MWNRWNNSVKQFVLKIFIVEVKIHGEGKVASGLDRAGRQFLLMKRQKEMRY